MRFVQIALIVLFTAMVLLFKVQNFQSATVTLLGASLTLPTSVLLLGVYVLGALTGWSLFGLLRSWVAGAREKQ
jgi:uncharacterized integral membrane protein